MARTYTSRWIAAAVVALSLVTAAFAAKKFTPKPATKYGAKQSQGKLTVAVKPFHTKALVEQVFPKTQPTKHGLLPVLLVITNGGEDSIGLEDLTVRYISGEREGIDAIPAEDLALWNPKGHQPRDRPRYIPAIPGMNRPKVKKGPLAKPEITESGFRAPVLAPGQSSHGFYFYNVGDVEGALDGATIYISGIWNLSTGHEFFYFEIALD